MKILITGIVGFIGSHMADYFVDQGYEVHGVDNFSSYYDVSLKYKNEKELKKKGVVIYKLDIRNVSDLFKLDKDFDYIFHFAAQPGLSSTSSFEDYYENNFIGTKNILDFALLNIKLNLFVNISTSSVYGLNATLGEESAPKPASYYGVTKLAAEQFALYFSRSNLLKVCSLRLYSVYGPRERPDKLYPKLVNSVMCQQVFTLFEGSDKHLRSYTYIDDIIRGIVSVIGKEDIVNGEVFNIGNDIEYSTSKGIEIIEKLTQKKVLIDIVPKRTGDQLRTNALIDKAKKVLQYSPSITLEQGLTLYFNWYKSKDIKY